MTHSTAQHSRAEQSRADCSVECRAVVVSPRMSLSSAAAPEVAVASVVASVPHVYSVLGITCTDEGYSVEFQSRGLYATVVSAKEAALAAAYEWLRDCDEYYVNEARTRRSFEWYEDGAHPTLNCVKFPMQWYEHMDMVVGYWADMHYVVNEGTWLAVLRHDVLPSARPMFVPCIRPSKDATAESESDSESSDRSASGNEQCGLKRRRTCEPLPPLPPPVVASASAARVVDVSCDVCDVCGITMKVIAACSLLSCPTCGRTRRSGNAAATAVGCMEYSLASHDKRRFAEVLDFTQGKE